VAFNFDDALHAVADRIVSRIPRAPWKDHPGGSE
jgi:hypothetical protein